MAATTIDDARRVKKRAKTLASKVAEVTGVGLTKVGGDYAVRVNVKVGSRALENLPERIDGVHVVYQVTGTIKPR